MKETRVHSPKQRRANKLIQRCPAKKNTSKHPFMHARARTHTRTHMINTHTHTRHTAARTHARTDITTRSPSNSLPIAPTLSCRFHALSGPSYWCEAHCRNESGCHPTRGNTAGPVMRSATRSHAMPPRSAIYSETRSLQWPVLQCAYVRACACMCVHAPHVLGVIPLTHPVYLYP